MNFFLTFSITLHSATLHFLKRESLRKKLQWFFSSNDKTEFLHYENSRCSCLFFVPTLNYQQQNNEFAYIFEIKSATFPITLNTLHAIFRCSENISVKIP